MQNIHPPLDGNTTMLDECSLPSLAENIGEETEIMSMVIMNHTLLEKRVLYM